MQLIKLDKVEDVEKLLCEMKYLFENVEKVNSNLKTDLRNIEAEQLDILHEIELTDLKPSEMLKIYRRLKRVRRERRVIKDKLDFISTLKGFTDKYNNSLKIYSDLGTLFKNINNLKSYWENRKYKPRSKIEDLEGDNAGTLDS